MHTLPALALSLLVLLLSAPARSEPGRSLTVSLLTMGPGLHPFTKFGHTAIWVHDAQTNTDEVYNFGTFAFDSPTLMLDSVQGKLPYWLSVQSLAGTLESYREQHRSLLTSELELTEVERAQLLSALRENARPEHRYYRYDYYRDNCATRVRGALDHVLGGRIYDHNRGPAQMSYRSHTLRLVADDAVLYVALDLALGPQTDEAITFWDEGFLPQRLHDLVKQTTVLRGGEAVPLVRSERWLLPAQLPEPRPLAPNWSGRYLWLGILLGVALTALGAGARANRGLRIALGVVFTLIGLKLGLLGCALGYLGFFSSHAAAAANFNVLLAPPWALLFAFAGVGVARGTAEAWKVARWAGLGALFSTVLALGIHVLGRDPQANGQELACALPFWIGALAASWLSAPSLRKSR